MADDDARMTLGEHFGELRTSLLRAVIGVAAGMVVCFCFGTYLIKVMLWPLAVATAGDFPKLAYFTPSEYFTTYLRVALIAGAILASPYGLYQMWKFVASGLYDHERRAVRKYLPPSIFLFMLGVAFFLVVVAPMVMRFFIHFARTNYPAPPTWGVEFWSRILLGGKAATAATAPAGHAGALFMPRAADYVSFVATLSFVFGLGFQTPLVVMFLGRSGLVPAETMRRSRRYVFLVIMVISAVVTPADVGSMVALAVPMYLLYEIGLLFAARKPADVEP